MNEVVVSPQKLSSDTYTKLHQTTSTSLPMDRQTPCRLDLTYFAVSVEALMLKNVAADSVATALAIIVFPFPGGPKRSNPAHVSNTLLYEPIHPYVVADLGY